MKNYKNCGKCLNGDCSNESMENNFREKRCCIDCGFLGECEFECYMIRDNSGNLIKGKCSFLELNK